jgi:hydroxymethylbilane synthase
VGIETQGDKIQDVALGKIEGKEFFVAELDRALRAKQTDISVHSLKDLSLDRPSDFKIAAVPSRLDSRDALLFHPDIMDRIRLGKPIRVGTSSPRRLELLPRFFKSMLPSFSGRSGTEASNGSSNIVYVEIRGNVNSRLSRIFEPENSTRKLDAVCLATAGLSRLYMDETAYPEIQPMLDRAKIMILPLSLFPSAPGQGALAVECRAADEKIVQVIQKLHDSATAEEVQQERQVLQEYGGGCHQRFGVSQLTIDRFKVIRVYGDNKDEWRFQRAKELDELSRAFDIRTLKEAGLVFDGSQFKDRFAISRPLDSNERARLESAPIWRVAHYSAWTDEVHKIYLNRSSLNCAPRIWVAGNTTWKNLASKGVWVEASADSLGLEEQCKLSSQRLKFLDLKDLSPSPILTHLGALERSFDRASIATYESKELKPSADLIAKIKKAKVFYWHSFSQFQSLGAYCGENVIHCCGAGRTFDLLKQIGVNAYPFPNAVTFQKWIQS